MVTKAQIMRWRKQAKKMRIRERYLSKRYGRKINISDLNPWYTRGGIRIPKALIKKRQRQRIAGYANTRTGAIDLDTRLSRSEQHRAIRHEMEHILRPRATERQVRRGTYKKFGYMGISDKGRKRRVIFKTKRRKILFFARKKR